jgi:hypothetical protein
LALIVRRDIALVSGHAPLPVRWSTTTRQVAAPAVEVVGPGVGGRPLRLKLHGDVRAVAATGTPLARAAVVELRPVMTDDLNGVPAGPATGCLTWPRVS